MIRPTTKEIAAVLIKALSPQQLAQVIDGLLTVEEDPKFTDREAQIGSALFGHLCRKAPQAMRLAQGDIEEFPADVILADQRKAEEQSAGE